MEKKGSRLVQPVSKGLTTDSKKNQDGASCKLWPRSGRRREPPCSSLSAKSEGSRKPTLQRTTRAFDNKRPRPRGTFNYNSVSSRTEATRLEEEYEVEVDSVFIPGSKKQSLNHLLNFVYTSPSGGGGGAENHYHNDKPSNRLMLTKKHKYNKEHFLQANCQFVVNISGDYKQYMNNPDALVDWSLIEQVNVQVSECPSCPICLYPPMAAKMTRCGHVYCWSCILHYLSLSDKAWRKCPICYELIQKHDLKSVITKQYKTFSVDDIITFKLMKRMKGSLIAYPCDATIRNDEIFNYSEMETNEVYTKLLLANSEEILSIIERENRELASQLTENGECPENCFIEEAVTLLNERKDQIVKNLDTSSVFDLKTVNLEEMALAEGGESPKSKLHYFYQASDGQHIYLHAINVKMLECTYGSLESSPKTLTGKILEKEGGSMTEELRKRLRYLQHLPVTCQFEVAEIQLKKPTVTGETLECFKDQLNVRRKRRQRRAKEEKKREKKIADEENRMLGKFPIPTNLHIESETQFPNFEQARARTESEGTQPSEVSSSDDVISSPFGSLNLDNEQAGPSFAKMLATVKNQETWPALKETQPPPAPVKLINVTGQKMATTTFKMKINRSGSEEEECEIIPPSRSLGDAIVQALQKAEECEGVAEEVTGKKKKKKNKQKILFTTTVAYTAK